MLGTSVRKLTFKSPPEYLLRSAIRLQRSRSSANAHSITRQCSGVPTYRAAICCELGKPLTIQQTERPALKKGEVRVAVHHAGINFADLLMVQGKYQERPPLPLVPGSELAGEVLEVSSEVKHLQPGDHVVCISQGWGGYAEECVLDNNSVFPLPEEVTTKVAASLLVSYGTAYTALTHCAAIKEGDTVLVTAAAGAVGLATVELAANIFNTKVIGACGGPEKCALVLEKGAFAAIDYRTENLRDRVKELTNDKGANIIIDAVGGSIFDQCLRCVAFEGKIVVIGFASGVIPRVPTNILLVKSCSVVGLYWGNYFFKNPSVFKKSISEVIRYTAEGRIKPHISKEVGLHQINEAMQFVGERKSTGKVVIDVRRPF